MQLAREVAGGRALVAGSVGPTGVGLAALAGADGARAKEALREHIEVLVDAGVDLLCLETFGLVSELELAIKTCREVCELPVVALCMFMEGGSTRKGLPPATVGRRLIAAGADVIGANCGGGPDHLFDVTTAMVGLGAPVMAMANAGNPKYLENRTIYVANPEYFGVFARRLLKAGVSVVGGCCGTTPSHTRRMANAVRMVAATSGALDGSIDIADQTFDGDATPLKERSSFGAKLAAGEFVTSVELNPPAGFDLTARIKAAHIEEFESRPSILRISMTSLRMSNISMAAEIAQHTGLRLRARVLPRPKLSWTTGPHSRFTCSVSVIWW